MSGWARPWPLAATRWTWTAVAIAQRAWSADRTMIVTSQGSTNRRNPLSYPRLEWLIYLGGAQRASEVLGESCAEGGHHGLSRSERSPATTRPAHADRPSDASVI